ncbi:SRPBCC family protein [Halomarina litorea]|uniref:SRPBCC family protein n=1 Tax=Halomarina litorea TaxID=2961595 RepID=UPI0020C45233|nr:SRPBCC family protein [Halomarina sp. BCD28]
MKVETSRFVRAPPAVVQRILSPVALVEAEGSFDVRGVEDGAGETLVHAGGYGVELLLAFEEREDGIAYTMREGPLDRLETTVTVAPEDEGSRITARSVVVTGGPAVFDRLAGWKRRGELKRALAAIEEQC